MSADEEQSDIPAVENDADSASIDGSPASAHAVPVVGIGASAGGLEAFIELLEALPPDTGLAFVFVLHLTAERASSVHEVLASRTRMTVRQAADGMPVEPNTIYTNPSDKWVTLKGDVLHTEQRPGHESPLMTVNTLLRSLAEARGQRSIGVILSGSAGDGAEGVRYVADAGGLVLVQQPDTAQHGHMPQEAIATGMAHLVLPPRQIAAELVRLARHPYIAGAVPGAPAVEPPVPEGTMARIFSLLRAAHGVDFGQYKPPTIRRRMHRRMALHRLEKVEDYLDLIQKQPEEIDRLFDDILIHVTRFFRDPETYRALTDRVFPELLAGRQPGDPIRIWIPGCSTGEETYSIAIALLEFLADKAERVPVQIFSTDVSERAVERARTGVYPESITHDLSRDRLARFFTRTDGSYRVRQAVREICVFARQDLTRDPPFSRLDLIVCRNVLIYLAAPAQKRLMGIFHYALKPGGFLMLGSAESVGQYSDLFSVADKKHKLYASKARHGRTHLEITATGWPDASREPVRRQAFERPAGPSLQNEATQVLLGRYAPPGVIVDEGMTIVQFRGQTGYYLEPSPGEPNLNLLKMARPGLLHALQAAIREAREHNAPARREGLHVAFNGHGREINLEVTPLSTNEKRHYLIIFEDMTARPAAVLPPPAPSASEADAADPDAAAQSRDVVNQLQRELAASREYMQSVIQDLEATNEELQSANEEILSSNEELQSTNEELDTAKEELQSTNEELNTVNEELHDRNEELSRVNSDLTNLLASVEIAIVMVGDDLKIRRFTPMAGKLLNLIPGDVGRSIAQIKPNIDCPDLEGLIHAVIEEIRPTEHEVRDADGRWYSLRIRPYKDLDRRINGAVLSLFDIDEIRRNETALMAARELADAIVDMSRQPLIILDEAGVVRRINRSFSSAFNVSRGYAEGRSLAEFDGHGWNGAKLRAALGRIWADADRMENIRIDDVGRPLTVNARRLVAPDGTQPPRGPAHPLTCRASWSSIRSAVIRPRVSFKLARSAWLSAASARAASRARSCRASNSAVSASPRVRATQPPNRYSGPSASMSSAYRARPPADGTTNAPGSPAGNSSGSTSPPSYGPPSSRNASIASSYIAPRS